MPTQAQLLAFVRWVITTGGAFAVGKGWVTTDQLPLIMGFAVALVPLVWSLFVHSDTGTMAAAKTVIASGATQATVQPLAQALKDAGAVAINTAGMPVVKAPSP